MANIASLYIKLQKACDHLASVLKEMNGMAGEEEFDDCTRAMRAVQDHIQRIRDFTPPNTIDPRMMQIPLAGLSKKARKKAQETNRKLMSRKPTEAELNAIFPPGGSVHGVSTGQQRKPGSHRS